MARTARRSANTKRRRILRYLLLAGGALLIIGLGTVVGFIAAAMRGLPSLGALEPNPALTSFFYDCEGQVLAEVSGWENRIPVELSQVPQHLIDAFIASEDIRFWTHYGIDLRGILRAAYRDIMGASFQEGASTLTQQFARNAFGLGYEKTITRKLQEVILAIQIERKWTKEEILTMYLNQIYFGHSAYGVQAASQLYFGKDVSELTLPEAALVCGVAKNANIYSPYVDANRAIARRNTVLTQMARYGKITAEQAEEAKAAPLSLSGLPAENYPAAYFVDYVLEYLLDRFSPEIVYRGGLRVYTTIDMSLQSHLEQAYADILDKALPLVDEATGEALSQPQSAAVFLDPETGAIRAMIGGRKHQKKLELNRAVPPRGSWEGTLRQPGSAFKPIVDYAPAIELGWSPASVLDDSVKTWYFPNQDPWSPENYNRLYRGLVSFREALELSINTVAVKVLEQIGVETGIRYAERFGIDTLVKEGRYTDSSLAVAIGGLTQGVSVLDMAQAYAVFANGGIRVEPFAVVRVEDKYGNTLIENRPIREVVLSEQAAYLVTDMLKGVLSPRGTGWRAQLDRPAAGKTGTTDNDHDAWFVGYTPEIVGAMWMGYDQPKPMNDIFGGTYLAPIWKQAVAAWLEGKPVQDWVQPPGIVKAVVCSVSGHLPGPHCPQSGWREELFIEGRQPLATCSVHVPAVVCARRPWQLARPECPEKITQVFIRRSEPFEVFKKVDDKTNRLMTYIPADAADEYPTEYCDFHMELPIYVGPTQEVVIAAYRWAFSPNVITVPFGTRVILKVQAQDANHGFALPAYGIDEICLKGRQKTIIFVADQPGTFTFYSSVYAGKDTAKMTGQFVVTGP
ncbi:MAG: PBP1A family penicillin-binding protein [Bacillota bacterium]|jgi:penicillin-binding protein 1A